MNDELEAARAEIARLSAERRPFADPVADKTIAEQVRQLDEVRKRLAAAEERAEAHAQHALELEGRLDEAERDRDRWKRAAENAIAALRRGPLPAGVDPLPENLEELARRIIKA